MWQKQSRCLVRLRATRGAQTQTNNTAFLCAALAAATRLPQPGLSLRSLHVHRSKSLLDRCPASWGKALSAAEVIAKGRDASVEATGVGGEEGAAAGKPKEGRRS